MSDVTTWRQKSGDSTQLCPHSLWDQIKIDQTDDRQKQNIDSSKQKGNEAIAPESRHQRGCRTRANMRLPLTETGNQQVKTEIEEQEA